MRIAVLQAEVSSKNVAGNLARLERAASEAAAKKARLLVAPELFLTGYAVGDAARELAEPSDGPSVAAVVELAKRHGLSLVTGFIERAGEAVYNAALLVAPDGRRLVYRKGHLYGSEEKRLFAAGPEPAPLFELEGSRIGLLICYDVEFPEAVRRLALSGADLIVVPTALPALADSETVARQVVPVRAFENQLFIAYADHCGREGPLTYAGLSCIVAPDGRDLARADPWSEALLVADVVPQDYDASRVANPYLNERRPDLYEG